jgi:hypothetical protein
LSVRHAGDVQICRSQTGWPDWANFCPLSDFTLGDFTLAILHWAIFHWADLWIILIFSTVRVTRWFWQMNGLDHIFGDFFYKLIRSPWGSSVENQLIKQNGKHVGFSSSQHFLERSLLNAQNPIIDFTPSGKLWPPGAKLSPKELILSLRGEVIPWRWNSLFAPPFF